jgi:hypothetical protein
MPVRSGGGDSGHIVSVGNPPASQQVKSLFVDAFTICHPNWYFDNFAEEKAACKKWLSARRRGFL